MRDKDLFSHRTRGFSDINPRANSVGSRLASSNISSSKSLPSYPDKHNYSTKPKKTNDRNILIRIFFRVPLWIRVLIGLTIIVLLAEIVLPIIDSRGLENKYKINDAEARIISTPNTVYADKISFDKKTKSYIFNAGYTSEDSLEVSKSSSSPRITAEFNSKTNAVTVNDPVNSVGITLKPNFELAHPRQDINRIIYPLKNLDGKAVFSLKGAVIKEDIILSKFQGDELNFDYELSLPEGLEPRLESNGNLSIYGVDSTLLGNVTTGSDKDAELLQKARQNSEKTNLLFTIPKPIVLEGPKKLSKAEAHFELNGNNLSVKVGSLKNAKYPLSIDPSVYVETAQKLMRGNNETNIDFDVNNELIQKSQTTGARIDSWSSTTNLSSAVYAQGTAVAGGYIYSVGGVGSGAVTTNTYNTAGSTSYVVPTGVTYITVKMWGAGGGGGAGSGSSGVGGDGGGGGYAKAVIAVTPGESLTVKVGTGGASASANSRGGNGGGASSIQRSTTYLVEAAGGGGGGGRRGNTSGTEGHGGAGGGTTGEQGTAGSTGGPGLGGTQSAGGTGGTGTGGGATGASQAGGNGGTTAACATSVSGTGGAGGTGGGGSGGTFNSTCASGGGGGGGYFGGGGGASTSTNNRSGGGGGGGSSYINPTGLVTGTDVNTVGSGATPANSTDGDRGGLGDGGGGATSSGGSSAGDNGIVVISYTAAGSITSSVYWAKFNPNTNAIDSPNPGNGACSGWCNNSAYNLPASRTGLSLIAYNGYLYAIGGSNSSGTPQTTVYIAKIGANGEPQLWHPTDTNKNNWVYWYSDTALSNARSYFSAVAYNNRIYLLGGLTTSTTVLSSNTVQFANINPMGTLTTWTSTGMQALSTSSGGNRYGLTAQVYNDTIYVIGGDATFSGTPVTNVDYAKLNSSDGTMYSWKTTSSLSGSGRLTGGGSFSTIFGGYVYVNGGCTAVNGSGYCTSIATDVQLASINSDGSIGPFNTITNLTNDRFAHTMIGWQGGLYRLGGCRAQDGGTGGCSNTVLDVDYGVINPTGEASTVATSSASGASTCTGSAPYYCDMPSQSGGYVGDMLNASTIINGYLYIMGGCSNDGCTTFSNGVTYQSIGSDGSLQKPSSCDGTYVDSYCVSNSSLPTALGAPGVTVFNNRIYVVGGFPSISNIYYVSVNPDGSLGTWQNNDTNVGSGTTADAVSYTYAYARANPASAGSVPGNLYIIGGCSGTITGIGCSGYSQSVYKCNITSSGTITGCTTTGQVQIGTVTGNDGSPAGGTGLGAMVGTVYANYVYLMGGLAPGTNGTDLEYVRYAKFDNSNNIVTVGSSGWVEGSNLMNTGRRRGAGFGYNGYLYVLGGYDGSDAIADIEFAKIDVSDGSWDVFDTSSVSIQKRWALTAVVSNSYAYVIGGCIAGPAPGGCTSRTDSIQTFQIYNNDSGTPIGYSATANQFTTDRAGAGSAIYNGFIYVAGGCVSTTSDCSDATDNVQFASIDAYGTIGTWANTTDSTLPGQRAHGKLLEAGGTLYWVGGQDDSGTAQNSVYYGTPNSSTGNVSAWTAVTSGRELPAARSRIGAASWNDRLYVTGGVNASGTAQTTVYVSPSLASGGDIPSTWSSSTSFNVARSGTATVAYANNLYIFGGYDGTNYLNDSQFTQINSDGTVDAWTYTTSLPTPIRQADAFAANGYIYVVGGRTSDSRCVSKTLVTPVSANTTIATGNNPTGIGEWFETNIKYSGSRYAASVSYANGKYYVLGGVCNGFPIVKDRLTQEFSTAATTHNVTMPATVDSGDLLLMLFTNDMAAGGTTTTPSGWSVVGTSGTSGNQVRATIYAKVASGSEDGTSVNVVTSATEEASSQVYRVQAGEWSGTLAGVEASTASTASTNTPNPASLNPAAWGTENTLWIAYAGGSSFSSVTSYPTNYNSGVHNLSNTGTGGASTSSAWLESATASEDPGAFTMANTTDSVAFTIAIRPAGYALTGTNKVVQTAVYSQPQLAKYSRLIDTDTDVFPNSWLLNGLDNSIGARWQAKYRSMNDTDGIATDCGTADMSTWGQETNFGDVTLGNVNSYTPKDGSGNNINCARYYYFSISIDASQTFGYPEDVNRGPTITDLSLFFTSDPSKRLRHGKTFTGGEQQPLDTPCRRGSSVVGDPNYNCPLP